MLLGLLCWSHELEDVKVFFFFFIALLGPAEGLSRQEESDFLKA